MTLQNPSSWTGFAGVLHRKFAMPTRVGCAAVLLLLSCANAGNRLQRTHFEASTYAIDGAIESAIRNSEIIGGTIWVESHGVSYHRAYGDRAVRPVRERATEETIYDVASLTKVIATSPAIWKLIETGQIDLDASASLYLNELIGERQKITVRHLLIHTSGLDPNIALDEPWSSYEDGIHRALRARLMYRPGAVFHYSDVNFVLLGEIVRRVSGEPLDVFTEENIFRPLGMYDTHFRPLAFSALLLSRIAPTERVGGEMVRGVPHDSLARRMGGVAGHAGLFSTTADIARFMRALFNGGNGVWRPETVRLMTSSLTPEWMRIHRAGGFDLSSGFSRPAGVGFSRSSFGHTGWTGCFMWADPTTHIFYVFLSNRVHPDGKGSVENLELNLGTLAARSSGAPAQPGQIAERLTLIRAASNEVLDGIDALVGIEYRPLIGLRVALLTDSLASDRWGNASACLFAARTDFRFVAIGSVDRPIACGVTAPQPARVANLESVLRQQDAQIVVVDISLEEWGDDVSMEWVRNGVRSANALHIPMLILDRGEPADNGISPTYNSPAHVKRGTISDYARNLRDNERLHVEINTMKTAN